MYTRITQRVTHADNKLFDVSSAYLRDQSMKKTIAVARVRRCGSHERIIKIIIRVIN